MEAGLWFRDINAFASLNFLHAQRPLTNNTQERREGVSMDSRNPLSTQYTSGHYKFSPVMMHAHMVITYIKLSNHNLTLNYLTKSLFHPELMQFYLLRGVH